MSENKPSEELEFPWVYAGQCMDRIMARTREIRGDSDLYALIRAEVEESVRHALDDAGCTEKLWGK